MTRETVGCRFFEQICCDSRINEQFFGMAQSTSPDFFGGVENSRADWPATTVYWINANPASVWDVPFQPLGPNCPAKLSEPSRRRRQHQTVRPTIPLKEEEYRLEPKPQLTTIRSIPRAAVKSPDGPSDINQLSCLLADILRSHMYAWREDGIATARTRAATTIASFGTRILNQ